MSPDTPAIAPVGYPDLGAGAGSGPAADLDLLAEVELTVTVEVGRVRMPLRELMRLVEGSVLELSRLATAPVDVLVNGSVVARGDVVVVDDELGVRITELQRRA